MSPAPREDHALQLALGLWGAQEGKAGAGIWAKSGPPQWGEGWARVSTRSVYRFWLSAGRTFQSQLCLRPGMSPDHKDQGQVIGGVDTLFPPLFPCPWWTSASCSEALSLWALRIVSSAQAPVSPLHSSISLPMGPLASALPRSRECELHKPQLWFPTF